jgi:MtaA/CmuA family methyltransferase
MTGKERIKAAIKFKEHDRVSCFPLLHWGACGVFGIKVSDFARNADVQASTLVNCCKKFGYDGINVGVDVIIEAEAFGGRSAFPDTVPPFLETHPINSDENKLAILRSFKVLDPNTCGRMKTEIEAARKVVKQLGREKYIMCYIMGPLNMASQLRGVQETAMDFLLDPDYLEELLDFSLQQGLAYGKALAQSGVDCIGIGEAIASPNFTSPEHIYKYDVPRITKLIEGLHKEGVDVLLHICGDITPLISYGESKGENLFKQTGTDILDVDYQINLNEAVASTGICCRGNLNPAGALLSGSREQVMESAKTIILGAGPSRGVILSSGCDMAYTTPPENIQAMMEAVDAYGRYPLKKI